MLISIITFIGHKTSIELLFDVTHLGKSVNQGPLRRYLIHIVFILEIEFWRRLNVTVIRDYPLFTCFFPDHTYNLQ